MLALQKQGKTPVPLDIHLDSNNRILLISGPNAGGKSVCLKTVGLLQYMMQCGMPVPMYDNSHMGIFDKIFIDIGDEQSIEDDLSTYSSHLAHMKQCVRHCDGHSLLLIDEFGGGTEPQIGGAIAEALLDRFNSHRSFGVITTHYQNLKKFAEDTEGIVNGAMLYDRHKMQPLFILSIGNPGSSFAIEIARKIGLPEEVIAEASEIVGKDYISMDKYRRAHRPICPKPRTNRQGAQRMDCQSPARGPLAPRRDQRPDRKHHSHHQGVSGRQRSYQRGAPETRRI